MISKSNLEDKTYYESFASSRVNSNSNTKLYSQTGKFLEDNLTCEKIKRLKYRDKSSSIVCRLLNWTCKNCEPCMKYKILQREHKIEEKFVKHPEINRDRLYILMINDVIKNNIKPSSIKKKLCYIATKYRIDVDLLLYARYKDSICYLVHDDMFNLSSKLETRMDNISYTITRVTTTDAIDFFGELNTKFLGPFYGDIIDEIKIDAETLQFLEDNKDNMDSEVIKKRANIFDAYINFTEQMSSTCRCGKSHKDHVMELTTEEEIMKDMMVIPEYEDEFIKFKKCNFPDAYSRQTEQIRLEEFV